jgi:ABC-2 type transport system permease protein
MSLFAHELRLLLRQRLTVFALALLGVLTIAALAAGMTEVARQRAAIAAIPAAQAQDIGAIANWVDKEKDAGSAAYYSFHATRSADLRWRHLQPGTGAAGTVRLRLRAGIPRPLVRHRALP